MVCEPISGDWAYNEMEISMFATESCNVKACIVDNMSTVRCQISEYHRQQMENVNDFDKRTLSSFYKVDSNNTSKKNIYFKAACSNLSVSLIAFS
jgi:hypothetical protein